MIDAGLWDERTLEGLQGFLEAQGGRDLQRLFLTHWHPDHHVGADRIQKLTRCLVGINSLEAKGADALDIDFTFEDGDIFPVEGGELEVIHTPGHSSGHCCFLLRPEGVLFTGDHILGSGTSIIVPPDGDMILYMNSLERLLAYPIKVICPGHGPLVWDAREKVKEYLQHRREREQALLEGVRAGVRRTEDLVRRVYTDIPVSFHGMAYFTVEAHMEKLVREGKVRRRQQGDGYEPQ